MIELTSILPNAAARKTAPATPTLAVAGEFSLALSTAGTGATPLASVMPFAAPAGEPARQAPAASGKSLPFLPAALPATPDSTPPAIAATPPLAPSGAARSAAVLAPAIRGERVPNREAASAAAPTPVTLACATAMREDTALPGPPIAPAARVDMASAGITDNQFPPPLATARTAAPAASPSVPPSLGAVDVVPASGAPAAAPGTRSAPASGVAFPLDVGAEPPLAVPTEPAAGQRLHPAVSRQRAHSGADFARAASALPAAKDETSAEAPAARAEHRTATGEHKPTPEAALASVPVPDPGSVQPPFAEQFAATDSPAPEPTRTAHSDQAPNVARRSAPAAAVATLAGAQAHSAPRSLAPARPLRATGSEVPDGTGAVPASSDAPLKTIAGSPLPAAAPSASGPSPIAAPAEPMVAEPQPTAPAKGTARVSATPFSTSRPIPPASADVAFSPADSPSVTLPPAREEGIPLARLSSTPASTVPTQSADRDTPAPMRAQDAGLAAITPATVANGPTPYAERTGGGVAIPAPVMPAATPAPRSGSPAGDALPPATLPDGTPMPASAPAAPAKRAEQAKADASTLVPLALPAAPPAGDAPRPAGIVFAAALHAARADRAQGQADLPGATATVAAPSVLPTAEPTATAPLHLGEPAVDPRGDAGLHKVVDRIEQLRDLANASDTRIRLSPDMLGGMEIAVRREGDAVHVHLRTDTAQAAQLLSEAQPRLAEIAEARGMRLAGTTIDNGAAANPQQQGQPAPQRPAPPVPAAPPRAKAAEDPTETSDARVA
ncbi:flagellar hook-length control protein FliK [Sphingomonas aracearum]|uniref:Flagellar hook-length control protein FliK n=1 Tax=Sphingomonas aracearum TaxID=2283317 RepID=A0A369VXM7_9SPHN|nr:flagellar hook-length control protein FliK [Sphingomonas aracearum]RDE05900.1 flagellar hook-length control protein FliK [Sphingomonas aracearum]